MTFRQMRAMIREIEAELRAADEAEKKVLNDPIVDQHKMFESTAETDDTIGAFKLDGVVVGLKNVTLGLDANWRN